MLSYFFFGAGLICLIGDIILAKKTSNALKLMNKKIVKGKLVDIIESKK